MRRLKIEREISDEESQMLKAMADEGATDKRAAKRARAVLAFRDLGSISEAAKASDLSASTVRKAIKEFNSGGWQSLISVQSPRGGDFLARYDQGYWAERLTRVYLDQSGRRRAIPYGTSRSEPFTDLGSFREYAIDEFLLQAWSSGQRWKRPDLLCLPRSLLIEEAGNDQWTPDLIHWDNERCTRFVNQSSAAIEVETSLWQVSRATVQLSFTIKLEDLDALRLWVSHNQVPLYIVQVFFDEAYALPFTKVERLIGERAPEGRRVIAETNRFTGKETYMIPLAEGSKIGDIPEPDVEGRIYKADNGRITVYGRLTGSRIQPTNIGQLEDLASGRL